MKKIIALSLLTFLTSTLLNAQVEELKTFTHKLFSAIGSKNNKTLDQCVLYGEYMIPCAETLEVSKEELKMFDKQVRPQLEIIANPEEFYAEMEDEVIYVDEEVLKNLDLNNFDVIHAEITDEVVPCEIGFVEVYAEVYIKSNDQFFMFELNELVYIKGKGYFIGDEPDISLASDEIWDKDSDYYFQKNLYKEASTEFVSHFFKKDEKALDAMLKKEAEYTTYSGTEQPSGSDLIDEFWEELEESGVSPVSEFQVLQSMGVEVMDDGTKEGAELLITLKVDNHLVFMEISATFHEGEMVFDDYYINNVIPAK